MEKIEIFEIAKNIAIEQVLKMHCFL